MPQVQQIIKFHPTIIKIENPREDKVFNSFGPLNGNSKYYYYPPNYQTTSAALINRHQAIVLPEYNSLLIPQLYKYIKKFIFKTGIIEPEDFIELIDDTKKKNHYKASYQKYLDDGRIPTIITPFTKIEKMKSNKYKAPRMIQARSAIFNIFYGIHIKPLENYLMKKSRYKNLFGKGDFDTIGKKIEHLRKKYKYYTECDHTTFDAHITVEMLKLFHTYIYNCFPHKRQFLRNLLRKTYNNRCISRHGEKYTIKGTRMSGEQDTSFANCLVNYAILKYMLEKLNIKGEVIVNGDDSIIFSDNPIDAKPACEILKTLNMESKILPSQTSIHKVEFCQTKLVYNNIGKPTMMSNPEKINNMFGMTYKITPKNYPKYINELLFCYIQMNSNNPIGHYLSQAHNIKVNPEQVKFLKHIETLLIYKYKENVTNETDGDELNYSHFEAYPDFEMHIKNLIETTFLKPVPKPPYPFIIDHDHKTITKIPYPKQPLSHNHIKSFTLPNILKPFT